jgi:hypothetical protein
MNREQAIKFLPLVAAFAEGKTIQYRARKDEGWRVVNTPLWAGEGEYRVKPEPRIAYVTVYTARTGSLSPYIGGSYARADTAQQNLTSSSNGSVMELVQEEGEPVYLRPLST